MVKTIKEVFDSKYFHGRLTDEEAYNLCKEEMTNTGKPNVYIWYLLEFNGRIQGIICGYRRDSEVPFFRHVDLVSCIWSLGVLLVERKNPHKLLELARVATLDNFNSYCCMGSLMEKIDELRIPATEKEELKKLVRGFHLILVENLPNELCIHGRNVFYKRQFSAN